MGVTGTGLPFADRAAAGRALARELARRWTGAPPLVLGLPRGGVPVAAEVARELGAALDVLVVRKLGAPGHPELAVGAVAGGGVRVLNPSVLRALDVDDAALEEVTAAERRVVEQRERELRGNRDRPALSGTDVLVVDDGLATGATARAAVHALRAAGAARVVVAVPVGAADAVAHVGEVADDVVCLHAPEPFRAVGSWYRDFTQTTTAQVRALLAQPTSTRTRPTRWEHGPVPEVRAEQPSGDGPAVEPAGDAVCWLERVCDRCGALSDGPPAPVCARCGEPTGPS